MSQPTKPADAANANDDGEANRIMDKQARQQEQAPITPRDLGRPAEDGGPAPTPRAPN